ncbi:thioredoxin family protein [Cytophagaceae bacterium DM2B3-1]|uniref:Thioredoxin family protein n=1 Tax=Xanthocytophaga flava TaxID=3048013 RepID=A0ABT7CPF2_9BACT|nr:thioredoxin family protein [Xanthocytophaga flavus]MDJ1467359.1 thioredoxin family protein [Xanthocytophaga flavus]MDJ1494870.1 thioredoxin family protein [Xanthocytophaga flavus]
MKKISELDFSNEVIQTDGLQIVHFYNPYSSHSNDTDTILEELYKTHNDVNFFKINLLHCGILCDRYGISLPCVLIFENGVLQDLLQDVITKDTLVTKLTSLLPSN